MKKFAFFLAPLMAISCLTNCNSGPKLYTVTFDAAGGTSIPAQIVKENDKVSKPANPTKEKEGYTCSFLHWELDNKEFSFNEPINKDITLVAKWKKTINKYELTVTSEDESKGTVTGGGIYDYNSIITITATPNTGYSFECWYEDNKKVSSPNPCTFTMPANDVSYEAKFKANQYTVTVTSEDESKGTVTGSDSYAYGSNVTIEATPNTGYSFEGWYEDNKKLSLPNPCTFNMPANDVNYEARFIANQYTVTVTSEDGIKGTVTGSGSYAYGSSVTIEATPSTRYLFEGWYEDNKKLSLQNPYTFNMPANNVSYEARFIGKPYTVTVTSEDEFKGTVQGGGTFAYNSDVTIEATPKEGYSFEGWYRNGKKIALAMASYTFTMPANDVSYEARFKANQYTVTVTSEDEIKGTVAGSGSYAYGSSVTIEAIPKEGYSFEGWYEDNKKLSLPNPYTFTMPKNNVSYEARFKTNKYTVTVTSEDEFKGRVKGGGTFDYNSDVTIEANPKEGYSFEGWYKNGEKVPSASALYTFKTPANNVSYEARFKTNKYTVTVTSEDTNKGTVTGGGTFDYDTTITITATPNTGYSFKCWCRNGVDIPSSEASYTFKTPANNVSYIAKFKANQYTVTVTSEDESKGKVTGSGPYAYGSSVTIEAKPNTGYSFGGWYEDNKRLSLPNPCTFNMPANDVSYEARFVSENAWFLKTDWWNYCSNGIDGEQATADDIGREVDLTVNEQVHKVRLIDIDHDELDSGNGKAHCTFEFSNLLSDSDGYSLATLWNTSEGGHENYYYTRSDLRSALDGQGGGALSWYQKESETKSETYTEPVINMLPEELKKNIKTVKKYVGTGYLYEITNYSARVFTLTYREMSQSSPKYVKSEGTTYQYYKDHDNDSSRIKHQVKGRVGAVDTCTGISDISRWVGYNYAGYVGYKENYGGNYWLPSPHSQYETITAWLVDVDGSLKSDHCVHNVALSVAPAFCV